MSPGNIHNSAITFMCWFAMIKIRLNFSPSGCELNLNQDNINHCYETTTYKSTKKIPLPRELAKKTQNTYSALILRTICHEAYVCDDVLTNSIGLIWLTCEKISIKIRVPGFSVHPFAKTQLSLFLPLSKISFFEKKGAPSAEKLTLKKTSRSFVYRASFSPGNGGAPEASIVLPHCDCNCRCCRYLLHSLALRLCEFLHMLG